MALKRVWWKLTAEMYQRMMEMRLDALKGILIYLAPNLERLMVLSLDMMMVSLKVILI